MGWTGAVAVAALAVTVPATLSAESSLSLPVPVVIRVVDNFGLSAPDVLTAKTEAQTILQRVGLDVSWVDCSRSAEAAVIDCQRPVGHGELIVRLVPSRAKPGDGSVVMGYSIVDPAARHACFATVSVDLVESVAGAAGVDARSLLGRAIAHEVGHLLLNTSRHSSAGLMRALWTRVELQRNSSADWQFAKKEAQIMRASLFVDAN
jgi:hypothetical protein